jgi:hypothetical protein
VVVLPAHLVATPVLERLDGERSGVVLGAGATAAWVDLDGFVVAVTTREVPLLPNAVALGGGSGTLARPGVAPRAPARLGPGRVDLGALRITWDPAAPPAWNPTVPVPPDADRASVARRGAALLRALGVDASPAELPASLVGELARNGLPTAVDPEGAAGLRLLLRGVHERDPVPAAAGARALLGRGPGLTPEGDDILAAVAGTLAVLGPTTGLDGASLTALLAAVAPASGAAAANRPGPASPPAGRTTTLSATLLALAAAGRLAEPAGRLLDLGPQGEAGWPAALARLERLGHGSGRAYAAGIAASALLLAAPGG